MQVADLIIDCFLIYSHQLFLYLFVVLFLAKFHKQLFLYFRLENFCQYHLVSYSQFFLLFLLDGLLEVNLIQKFLNDNEQAKKNFMLAKNYDNEISEISLDALAKIYENEPTAFISKIKIENVLHLKNIEIEINESELRHLVITGKNGVGKSVTLNAIKDYLKKLLNLTLDQLFTKDFEKNIDSNNKELVSVKPKHYDLRCRWETNRYIIAHIPARRKFEPLQFTEYRKIDLNKSFDIDANIGVDFEQYMVNLKIDGSLAETNNDNFIAQKTKKWFEKFEEVLRFITNDSDLVLHFDYKNKLFYIKQNNRLQYNFRELADGISSILDIVSNIMLRMESRRLYDYSLEGLVLIDEPEAHLHIEMQKKILPILTKLFPRVQFIVATHSPFILSSLENAVVYDLETNQRLENAYKFSATSLVKNHFEVPSEQSQIIDNNINKLENLVQKLLENKITKEEEKEIIKLDEELSEITLILSNDNFLRLKKIHNHLYNE